MKLSVVVPCYNEVATIVELLEAVRAAPWPDMEVIVVDDCSTDGSRQLLQSMQPALYDQLVLHERNAGKGAALRSGIAAATGEGPYEVDAQGTVVVVYTMDTSGSISEARVEKSSGVSREHKMLDRMTLEAVQACKGTPGTVDGKPEKLSGRIEYVWKLTD